MLYQSILEAASSAGEWHHAGAGVRDAPQHAIEAFVWACWGGPQAVVLTEEFVCHLWSGDPVGHDVGIHGGGRVVEGVIDGNVSMMLRIEVADDADADHPLL